MTAVGAESAIRHDARPVSMVIPTRNAGPRFLEILEALASQDLPGGFELIVIDSESTDGTAEAAERAGARVVSVSPADFNHGRTRNAAIGHTQGEIVALLTHDSLPMRPSYLSRLVSAFENPRVDGAYARQFPRPDCDPILAARLRQWSATRDKRELSVLVPGDAGASRSLYEALPPMERYLSSAFDNVASAVRRSTWERIPFPERSFGEDVAWGREVLLSGGALAFEPDAMVEHSHRIRMLREFRRIYCDHRNLMELFELFNVQSWTAVRAGWARQREVYAELLDGELITRRERRFWRAYSVPYALFETAAQFLGARSHWKTAESRFWRWADAWIRRGV